MVQKHTDDEGGEVLPERMWDIFSAEYLSPAQPRLDVSKYTVSTVDGKVEIAVAGTIDGATRELTGLGNGPIDAFVHALSSVDIAVRVLDYAEHALSAGGDAKAAAYVECEVDGESRWGVGIDPNIVTASLRAVASAVNRA